MHNMSPLKAGSSGVSLRIFGKTTELSNPFVTMDAGHLLSNYEVNM